MGYLPGVRWRKTITIFPGVRINLSKTGVSASVGGKGATLNVGRGRQMITVGIPGTGLSYRVPVSGAIIFILLGAVVIIGLAYLINPDLVHQALHWWQPKWFPASAPAAG